MLIHRDLDPLAGPSSPNYVRLRSVADDNSRWVIRRADVAEERAEIITVACLAFEQFYWSLCRGEQEPSRDVSGARRRGDGYALRCYAEHQTSTR